jgi:hypothetical protein
MKMNEMGVHVSAPESIQLSSSGLLRLGLPTTATAESQEA